MKPGDPVILNCPSSPWNEWVGVLTSVLTEANKCWVEVSGQSLWFWLDEVKLESPQYHQPETSVEDEIDPEFLDYLMGHS